MTTLIQLAPVADAGVAAQPMTRSQPSAASVLHWSAGSRALAALAGAAMLWAIVIWALSGRAG